MRPAGTVFAVFALALAALGAGPPPPALVEEERAVADFWGRSPIRFSRWGWTRPSVGLYRGYPGGPITACESFVELTQEQIDLLSRLPSLRSLSLKGRYALDLTRLRALRRAAVPTRFFTQSDRFLPIGLRELVVFNEAPRRLWESWRHKRRYEDRIAVGLSVALRGLPALESLHLCYTDLPVGTLGLLTSRSVKRISLSECLPGGLRGFPALEHLEAVHPPSLAFLASVPRLRTLRVTGRLDGPDLAVLRRMNGLRRVEMGRGLISPNALTALRASLRDTEVVEVADD